MGVFWEGKKGGRKEGGLAGVRLYLRYCAVHGRVRCLKRVREFILGVCEVSGRRGGWGVCWLQVII